MVRTYGGWKLRIWLITWFYNWAALCENVSLGICGQRRPRSACASAQSDQGLHFPLTESLDTTDYMNDEQMLRYITKTLLFKYIENFTTKKGKISDKKILIFFIFLLKT